MLGFMFGRGNSQLVAVTLVHIFGEVYDSLLDLLGQHIPEGYFGKALNLKQ